MLLHNIGENVPVLGDGKALDRPDRRERLEAKFGKVPEEELSVLRKGLVPVPYIPVVRVAAIRTVRIVEASSARRRSGPVESVGILSFHYRREDVFVHPEVIGSDRIVRAPAALSRELLHLIVAAPESEARVMCKSSDLAHKFRFYVFLKFRCKSVIRACEHEILPYHKPEFVTCVVEIVCRIESSAPDTDAVEVRIGALLQKFEGACPSCSREDIVLGDVIRTHREELHAVDDLRKLRAVLVFRCAHFKSAESDTLGVFVKDHISVYKLSLYRVKRLLSESVRPPEAGILYYNSPANPVKDDLPIRICYGNEDF